MEFLNYIAPAYSALGFCVGLLVGVTGVGGGALMTPLLVLFFGVTPATAVGTDLLYACITKGCGTLVHGLNGSVDWKITARLAAGSVPATVATLSWLYHLHQSAAGAAPLISTVLGVALIATALSLIFRKKILAYSYHHHGELPARKVALLTVLTGAVLGILVSLSSVGAGAIGCTVLLLLYPRLPVARIVGSDIAHAVPLTLLAGIGHWWLGSVDWAILLSLLVGSLPGVSIGSYVSSRIPDRILRPILATTLVVVGGKMLG